jgi:1-aminocyclopropane-1-carboxylate deaminase
VKKLSLNLPSPIEQLPDFSHAHNVYVKREELIHPEFGGNKWRKLKLNIDKYYRDKNRTLITFGGPFSNHIAATAAVCAACNIPSIGIIRGTYVDDNNPTLTKAKERGMILHHVPKEDYKIKVDSELIRDIIDNYEKPLVISEGGNNAEGIDGMLGLMAEIYSYPIDFNLIGVAAGTGATSAGMIRYSQSNTNIKIINVLRNQSLTEEISSHINNESKNWQVIHDYHFGGYAKTTDDLRDFAQEFYNKYQIALDPIYNSKLFYGMRDLMQSNCIEEETNILLINTGGYQGIDAYNYVNGEPWIKK